MTSTSILIVLLVFSFIIGRFLRRFDTPHFVFSGMLYLLLGLLIGSHLGFGLLSDELLYKLEPMTDLMTGIAGFLLGLRFPLLMKNKRSFVSGVTTTLVTFALTAVALYFVSPFVVNFSDVTLDLSALNILGQNVGNEGFFALPYFQEINRRQFWFALGASCTACSVSLLSLGMISKFNKSTSEVTRVLSIIAPSGQLVAVALLGFCLAMARADTSATSLHISLGEWMIATLSSGLLCAMLFSLFIGRQSDENRILLAALGAIVFAAGIGTLLSVSSLFVCFLTGLIISIFSSYSDVLKKKLIRLEEPLFVLLLVIAGASWQPEINSGWVLPLVYFLVRGFAFSFFAQPIHRRVTHRKLSRLGQGLLGQDLIAVAIALSLAKEFTQLSQLFLTTILGSIFLNDIVANSLLKQVILDNEQSINIDPLTTQEGEQ